MREDASVAVAYESRDRLLRAVIAITSTLELESTLRQIVRAAVELIGARYGALGVLGDDGALVRFIHEGIDSPTAERIGPLPTGGGVLGVITAGQRALRLDHIAAHPASVGFPAHHPTMETFLGVPIVSRGATYGRIYLTEKPGGFTADDELVMQALAGAAGIAVENARLFERVRMRQRWLEATGAITERLLRDQDVDQALEFIANRARELSDADYAIIAVPERPRSEDPTVRHLRVAVLAGSASSLAQDVRIPVDASTAGAAFRLRAPQRVSRLQHSIGDEFGPAIALPLGSNDRIAGVLVLVRRATAEEFSDEETQIAASFADQAALALRRADDVTTRRESELISDRDRIARDLHDQVIQRLFAVGLAMQSTQRRSHEPEVAARVVEHIDVLQQVIQDIRTVIFDLHENPREARPFAAAVHSVVAELTENTGYEVSVVLDGALNEVPIAVQQHVEAVTREAVSNAVRHSQGHHLQVRLTVSQARTRVDLQIRDDGIGICDDSRSSGLANIAARADAAGGHSSVVSDSGGTSVYWSAPFDQR